MKKNSILKLLKIDYFYLEILGNIIQINKNNLKPHSLNKFKSILFFSLLFISFEKSKASHATGAEFSYTYVSPNVYEITYTFYRDCHGILPSTSIDIEIINSCGLPSQVVFLPQVGTETDIETTCPTAISECHGGTYAGRQKWVYRGNVTLGGPCAEWQIGHAESARNAAISTIQGSGSDNLYVYCLINNMSGIVNSSPVFINDPVVIYSVNQRLSIDNSVFDSDGDSLSFEMIVPRTGPSTLDTVDFVNGYFYDQPFISITSVSIEANTGLIEGMPVQSEATIYAVLVNEYRNGILIGQIERDLNFLIESSTNFIPDVAGFFGSSDYTIDVFANQQNCFQIPSIDANGNSQTSIDINCNIPGMTYFSAGGLRDTAFFCWNPSLADTSGNPYCFTVSVKDDNCSLLGYQARSYCVNVQLPVGLNEMQSNDITIYPNPFNSEIKIRANFQEKSVISIFDLQGRKFLSRTLDADENLVDLKNLENGMYLISVSSIVSGRTIYKRILKEN